MRFLASAGLSLALVSASQPTLAQNRARAAAAASSASSASPAPGRTASPARLALVRGQQAYVAHRYDEALAAFREAQGAADERVEATLDIGYTQAARNEREAAIATFREAISFCTAADDAINRTRALQAIANTYEAMGNIEQSLAAWQDYLSFAEAHPTLANAAVARARIDALHQRQQADTRDAQVRQRIEERRRRNAAGNQGQQQ
jgi:tetratricopeptide (TPR) repeat protein